MTDVAIPATEERVPHLASVVNLAMLPVAVASLIFVLGDFHSPIRIWLAVALFFFGAGSGITQFLRLPDAALQFGVLIGLSVAADLLTGQLLLGAHNVNGKAAICILAGLTFLRPIPLGRKS